MLWEPCEEAAGLVRRQRDGEQWIRAFIVVSAGRTAEGRVSRFRISEFE